ncbi:MAG: response regulator transcription factor [Leptospirales bacterium]|nr:response regulator transcription factor [Leptospirales bacterium]
MVKLVLVVDDHPLVFTALKAAAELRRDHGVVFEQAKSLGEARRRIERSPAPDLLLLDIQIGDESGFMLAEELKGRSDRFLFAVLTSSRDWNHLNKALQLGAQGFLSKDAESEQILSDITRMLKGERLFPEPLAPTQAFDLDLVRNFHTLTEREKEVLKLILAGLLNREIAEELKISLRTVEAHRARASEKLGAENSIQLSQALLQLRHLLEAPGR